MGFRSGTDIAIAEKMLRHPLLGEDVKGVWRLRLGRELHMTDDRALFHESPAAGLSPLFEGKMIHQFSSNWAEPRYWVDLTEARRALLGRQPDEGQRLDYQRYRIAHRAVAKSTHQRTMIATVLPPNTISGHSVNTARAGLRRRDGLFLVALLNSFTLDYLLRQNVPANLTISHIYRLPVPRLGDDDPGSQSIIDHAARLICTTSEFDELARKAGLRGYQDGVTDPIERGRLRAELDGLIAHLYGLTEAEFSHILGTFPLVPDPIKVAAQNAFRNVERGLLV